MKRKMLSAMTKRDRARCVALEHADEALYYLWKQCAIDEPMIKAVNGLQNNFIHPEIRKLRGTWKRVTGESDENV